MRIFIHENNFLFEKQTGFRPNSSCVTSLDVGNLKFSHSFGSLKAFDIVNYNNTHCYKLQNFFNFASIFIFYRTHTFVMMNMIQIITTSYSGASRLYSRTTSYCRQLIHISTCRTLKFICMQMIYN